MRRTILLGVRPLVLTLLLTVPAGAVVQARAPGLGGPRVSSTVVKAPTAQGSVAITPLQDAPRTPGSGARVAEALGAALARRDLTVTAIQGPADASGTPVPGGLVQPASLAGAARAVGAAMGLTGQVQSLSVEDLGHPGALVVRRGVYVGMLAEDRVRVEILVRIQVVAAGDGRLLYEASVRHGPVDAADAETVITEAVDALVARWLDRRR